MTHEQEIQTADNTLCVLAIRLRGPLLTHVVEGKDLTASFMHTQDRWDLKAARTLIAAEMTPEQTLLARQVSVSWEKEETATTCHRPLMVLGCPLHCFVPFQVFPFES